MRIFENGLVWHWKGLALFFVIGAVTMPLTYMLPDVLGVAAAFVIGVGSVFLLEHFGLPVYTMKEEK